MGGNRYSCDISVGAIREASPYQNGWIFGKVPNGLWPPPLIFGKSCCRFFKQLYSLKNHTCGIFLKSPGYESIKNNDPCCQIQSLNFKFWGWLGPRLLVHWGFLTIVNSQWGYNYLKQEHRGRLPIADIFQTKRRRKRQVDFTEG